MFLKSSHTLSSWGLRILAPVEGSERLCQGTPNDRYVLPETQTPAISEQLFLDSRGTTNAFNDTYQV
jgi:hypothetical protein